MNQSFGEGPKGKIFKCKRSTNVFEMDIVPVVEEKTLDKFVVESMRSYPRVLKESDRRLFMVSVLRLEKQEYHDGHNAAHGVVQDRSGTLVASEDGVAFQWMGLEQLVELVGIASPWQRIPSAAPTGNRAAGFDPFGRGR